MKNTSQVIIMAAVALFIFSFNLLSYAEPVVPNGFKAELWWSSTDALLDVRAGLGGAFGTYPYVADGTTLSVLRINGQGSAETFATGLYPGSAPKLAFDPTGAYGGDMYVNDPQNGAGIDNIYRINPSGGLSLFSSSNATGLNGMTNGIDFGKGGGFGNYLYAVNSGGCLEQFSPAGVPTSFGSGLTTGNINDDLVISGGGTMGTYAYATCLYEQQILRMSPSGEVSLFSTGLPYVQVLALGTGGFGDTLYAGSGDQNGAIYSIDGSGNPTLFASNLGGITGMDIQNGIMWVTAFDGSNNGVLYRITPVPEPITLSLLLLGGLALLRRKV